MLRFHAVWLACPDYPVPKHEKQDLQAVTINDGRHVHAIGLNPPQSRLKDDLGDHFEARQHHYVRDGFPLSQIDAKRIKTNPAYVAEYAFKSLIRGRVDFDQVIILSRTRTDLSASFGFKD